ncbi:hypothetical protein L208DRAFT_1158281, partial [Tricholoma matsutake]
YRARFLHCDFSPGNIIITVDGKGLLIDWDLSKLLAGKSETPRHAMQTMHPKFQLFNGTWQFMSARLVARLDGVHSFQDDLKLTIYVLLYMILMYSETSDRD